MTDAGALQAMRRALWHVDGTTVEPGADYTDEAAQALMTLASHGYVVVPFKQHADTVAALRFIAGPSDSGVLIEVYREAGGGYEGLQAIARDALGDER